MWKQIKENKNENQSRHCYWAHPSNARPTAAPTRAYTNKEGPPARGIASRGGRGDDEARRRWAG
jgi:hypothetical protein